jgi:long-chain acyl-CoA synthetase
VTIDVLEQRAELEDAIKGRTLCDQLLDAAQKWGDRPAFSDRDDGDWQTISWAQARQQVLELAAGFRALGLAPGDRVALMLPNRLEHVLADQAAVHAGGVPVTFYATFAPDQVGYVAGDCDARVAVLDGADELARWEPVLGTLPGLKKIIVRDPGACPSGDLYLSWPDFAELGRQRFAAEPETIHELIRSLTPRHPASVLYTSGTTGNPKGVVITHHNVLYELMTATVSGMLVPRVRWVSYLPLAHIAERMFTIYLAVHTGGHVYFCHTASTDLVRTVGDVKPNSFFGVPRVWEKIQAGLQAVLAMETDPAKRAAIEAAMKTGRRYVESCQFGQSTPDELAEQFRAADETILRPIRSLLGLGDAEVVLSAAAPLPLDVAAFFAGLGMKILDVYGMTETTGAFTSNTPAAFKLGTVGRAVAGMEITIAEDGEILTRGPLDTPGYLNQPERTADLIDADGWLHTGDIGSLDADGFLSVVDRKKELIITSGGENISPAAIENLLVAHPLIGQALAYGNDRRFVVALLTLDGEVAPAWAKARGIDGSLAELAEHPTVLAVVAEAVAGANARLARVQQVKTWRLLPVEWTAESEELTPTLKLKRRVVHAKYADIIDSLYGC